MGARASPIDIGRRSGPLAQVRTDRAQPISESHSKNQRIGARPCCSIRRSPALPKIKSCSCGQNGLTVLAAFSGQALQGRNFTP